MTRARPLQLLLRSVSSAMDSATKSNFSIPLLVMSEIFGWLQIAAILTFNPTGCLDDDRLSTGACASRPRVQTGAQTVTHVWLPAILVLTMCFGVLACKSSEEDT